MRVPRIYQPEALETGKKFLLTATTANHLVRVLRLPIGASVKIFNGAGGEFTAKIIAIRKAEVTVEVENYLPGITESPLKICLGQGISRGERMDFVIQKTVELGVTHIVPLITKYCEVKLSDERWEKRLQHWQAVAIAACEQSGRNKLPTIEKPCNLSDWLNQATSELKLVLDPTAQKKLSDIPTPSVASVDLLLGPEGGLDEVEIALATHQGFAALSLGARVLRTETAAMAAVTAMQCRYGDMF